ncbi:MAG: helix-turn-helix transcriptional regulator [Planctomycetes bacterium]|nr:helix-turn-helix transcriptional regulator [Planctomycetota bacterium]
MTHIVNIIYNQKYEKYFLPDRRSGYDSALYRIAHEKWDKGSYYRASNISVITLMFVASGKGEASLCGESFIAEKGLVMIYGGETEFTLKPQSRMEVYVICVAQGMGDLILSYGLKESMRFPLGALQGHVFRNCSEMIEMALSDCEAKQDVCNHYMHALFAMIGKSSGEERGGLGKSETKLRNICNFIDTNLERIRSARDIAEYSGYTPEHLSRMFKKHKGVTLLKYIRKKQMLLAEHLIGNSGFLVEEAADYFGFSDAYSFSKAFRKTMGFSPGACRKKRGLQ